jgi:DNA-binding LacI/PurR family transcriptional regulator
VQRSLKPTANKRQLKTAAASGPAVPLYATLINDIRRRIETGELQPGDKLPATLKMAAQYDVCHKTVQLAMKALVREGLLIRRKYFGTFVAAGTSGSYKKPAEPHVALLMKYIREKAVSDIFDTDIVDGIMEAAAAYGCRVDINLYSRLDTLAMDRSLTGFLLVRPSREEALQIKRLGLPTVLLDIAHSRLGLGFARSDNARGVRMALRYLIQQGHRKILYLHSDCSNPYNFSGIERYRAFMATASEYKLPMENSSLLFADFSGLPEGSEYTALLTDGVMSTRHTLNILLRQGIRCPQDISFIGFDDVDPVDFQALPLTVIRQRLDEVGRAGLKLLLDQDRDWRRAKILVSPELIIRGSTASHQSLSSSR